MMLAASLDNALGAAVERARDDERRRVLLTGGTVLSMDPAVGDLACGDVLIAGDTIEAVAPAIDVSAADVLSVDATGMIVLPGLQDTHRHCWQGQFRRWLSHCGIGEYMVTTHQRLAPAYAPEDVYTGCLLSAWGAVDGGVTTVLDYMHNTRSLDHALAAIEAFRDVGLRGVHGSAPPPQGEWDGRWLENVRTLRGDELSSDDGLLTLRLAPYAFPELERPEWTLSRELLGLARELGIGTVVDAAHGPLSGQLVASLHGQGLLGPDVTLVHCTEYGEEAWQAIAASGTQVSLAVTSDAQLGIYDAIPPIQAAMDHGVRPGLSVDVECSLSTDMFAQMQAVYTIQRMLEFQRRPEPDRQHARLLTTREVLEAATIDGACVNGLERRAGSLTPGKQADVIVVAGEDVNTMPLNNAVATVVLGADSRNVRAVFVAGRLMKWNERLVGCDVGALRARVHASRDALLERSGFGLDVVS